MSLLMVADRPPSSFFQRVAFWQPSNLKWSPFKNFWLTLFSFFLSVSHQLTKMLKLLKCWQKSPNIFSLVTVIKMAVASPL